MTIARWARLVTLPTLFALGGADAPRAADSTPAPPPMVGSAGAVEERLHRLETLVAEQSRQIQDFEAEQSRRTDPRVKPATSPPPPTPILPEPAPNGGMIFPESFSAWFAEASSGPSTLLANRDYAYLTGSYNKGFLLVEPTDKQRTPFALKFNLTTQMRYTGFTRSVASWTESSGKVLPITNRSYFALNRNFLTFSGYAFSPQLQYNLLLFSTSTSNENVLAGSLSYELGQELTFHAGYYLVPSTREWITPFADTLGADRTLANTFFRAAFSPGVWANGEFANGVHYIAGIFNDFNAPANGAGRINNNMTYSGNIWWDPLGPFGPGYTDEEYHDQPALRTGTSLTYQRVRLEPDQQVGIPNPENTLLRLSDGTPIFQPGALAPGVTLQGANVSLFSYDLALKYRGFSLSGEYYGRWINGLDTGGGVIPRSNLNLVDSGGLVHLAHAIIPRRLELFARTSAVFGKFGDGSEYGGGVNWYPYQNRNVRGTFEAKRINHSPADNLLYGYFAGESGTLFQVQLVTSF